VIKIDGKYEFFPLQELEAFNFEEIKADAADKGFKGGNQEVFNKDDDYMRQSNDIPDDSEYM
jgi:hypothetical protein